MGAYSSKFHEEFPFKAEAEKAKNLAKEGAAKFGGGGGGEGKKKCDQIQCFLWSDLVEFV